MKLFHLRGADMQPFLLGAAKYVGNYAPKRIICHCVLIDDGEKLSLIDTGFGMAYVKEPKQLSLKYRASMGPSFNQEDTVAWQMEQLGYKAEDVTDVYLTHLHVDHAGGLMDFSQALIHTVIPEFNIAMQRPKREHKRAYYPQNWNDNTKWQVHAIDQEWEGFPAALVRDNQIKIRFIHLPGHTAGHCGVLVETKDYRLFHCGDAFLDKKIITQPNFDFPSSWKFFRWFLADDDNARDSSVKQILALVEKGKINSNEITCAHDEADLLRQQRRATDNVN